MDKSESEIKKNGCIIGEYKQVRLATKEPLAIAHP